MAKERVLLVDDEAEFTEALCERMKARGLEVDTADSGYKALDKVKDESYDAISLDMAMPGLDGIETMKKLLEKHPDLQIILLTGYATLEKGVKAVKLGAKDFLEKPADINKLMKMIKDAKAERMLLVEKSIEDDMKKILKSKGW